MAASEVVLDVVVTEDFRTGRTTQTGRGPLALVCDLSSCSGWKTSCLMNAPLLVHSSSGLTADKSLKEEAPFPPRPSPRVPNPRTREEWGIQEAASLPATTRGQITNQGQGSSTSLGPPRPKPSVTTTSRALAANTLGQGSGGASGHFCYNKWQQEE